MPNQVLDKSYRITTTGGAEARRVVVVGSAAGDCALPSQANAYGILGITTQSQPQSGRAVTVRKSGIAEVVAAGTIALGVPVVVAGTSGKVKAVSEDAGVICYVVGFAETAAAADGDVIEVFLAPHCLTMPE